MGGVESVSLPNLPFANNYTCIAISNYCALYLLYPGQEEIKVVRDAIKQYWPDGIVDEKIKLTSEGDFPKCYQFVLSGAPFRKGNERYDTVRMRLMTTKILQSMSHLGWKLLISTDLSRVYDQTTWIFRRTTIEEPPPRFFSIGISSSGTLQINNGTDELCSVIRHAVNQTWDGGIVSDDQISRSCYEIALRGAPWCATSKSENCAAKLMLRTIIQSLASKQMLLYGNSNLKDTADTLFFQYNAGNSNHNEKYLMLSLHGTDCLRLIPAPPHLCDVVQRILRHSSACDLRKAVRLSPYCFEFKSYGSLWNTTGTEAIMARTLILHIMKDMLSHGYLICTGIDLSRNKSEKDVLLFRKVAPLDTNFFCLAPKKMSSLLFLNAPPEIIQAGRQVIQESNFTPVDEFQDNNVYSVEFGGCAWQSVRHGHGIHGRVLLLWLIHTFSTLGWRLVCSMNATARCNHQNKTETLTDVHSLYFMYDETMLAGNATAPPDTQSGAYNLASAPPELTNTGPPPYVSVRNDVEEPPPSYEEVTANQSSCF